MNRLPDDVITAFRTIYEGDPCSLAGVILILLCLGNFVADEQERAYGLRIAILIFLAFGILASCYAPPRDAQTALTIAIRSVVAFGLALGFSWIVLPLVLRLSRILSRRLKQSLGATGTWISERRHQAEADRRRWEEDEARRLSAPERLRAERAADVAARAQSADQKRRDDARAACEVLFHLHAHALAERLPKATFDDFMKRYMGDSQSAEYVEERGRQLMDLILSHARKVSPHVDGQSLQGVLSEFQGQIDQIQNSALDEEWKVSLIAELQQKFYERLRTHLDNT